MLSLREMKEWDERERKKIKDDKKLRSPGFSYNTFLCCYLISFYFIVKFINYIILIKLDDIN